MGYKGKHPFMVGDTVKINMTVPIPCDIINFSSRHIEHIIVPCGAKALIAQIQEGTIQGVKEDMYRLYFGFKNRKTDLWLVDDWRPTSCRKVLIEKKIPIELGNAMEIDYYRNSL